MSFPTAADATTRPPGPATRCSCRRPASKFRALLNLGLTDAHARRRPTRPACYTFWDYQAGAWQKNNGIRIDHLLLSPQAADRLLAAGIDRHVRGWDKPSDHVPVYSIWISTDGKRRPLEFLPIRVVLDGGGERGLHTPDRSAAVAGGSSLGRRDVLRQPGPRDGAAATGRWLATAVPLIAFGSGVELEEGDALVHRLGLVLQRLGGGGILLDQRRVLLRHLVHLRRAPC